MRRRVLRPLALLIALLTAVAGLVSVAVPAQAAGEPVILGAFGTSGTGPGQFTNANDLAVGPNGHVYLADPGNQRIQEFTAEGVFVRSSVRNYYVSSVAVSRTGQVYGVDSMGAVLKYASDLQSYTEIRKTAGSFGIAIDGAGNLYVTETAAAGRILKLDSNGQLLATWTRPVGDTRSFKSPYGIAVDGTGKVHVADYGNGRVVKLDTDGNFVSELTTVGGRALAGPYDVAADDEGRLAVAEINQDRMTVLSADGALEATWDVSGPNVYAVPYGPAFGLDGRVYVLGFYLNQVQMFRIAAVFEAFTPTIAGSGRVGDALTVSASTTPDPASWTYAWTVAGSDVVRSDEATFTPEAADQGKTVTVSVTAKGSDGTPQDRTATATKAITGALMDTTATIVDSTPGSAPTTGDVLTVEAAESTLPGGATASVRWGRLAGQDCAVAGAAADEYTVVDGDAGATLCAEVTYAAAGHETFTTTATAGSTAVGTFTAPAPTVDDETPVVNQTITASVDLDDAPEGADVTSWQWGVVDGDDCVAIAGADEATFTSDVSDFEKVLCVTAIVSAPHHLDATRTVTAGAVGAGAFAQSPTVALADWAQVGVESSVEVTGGDPADADRAYQWNLDGDPIDGATQATFTPRASDDGHDLSVTVTSSSRGYVADVTPSNEVEVAAGRLGVPTPTFDTTHPRVGVPVSLPVDLAEAPEGAEATWQWGTRNGEACVAIGGAEGDTFTPTSAQVGEPLCVVFGVTAPGYAPTEAIFTVENAVVLGMLPTISAVLSSTTPSVGATLTTSLIAGELPAGASTRVTWGHAANADDCRPDEVATAYDVTRSMAGGVVCALVGVTAPGYSGWSTVLVAEVAQDQIQVATPVLSTDRPAVGVAVSLPVDLSGAPEGAEAFRQWGVVAGEECVAISGATNESFTPTADQVEQVLCADVTVSAANHFSFEVTVVAENAVVRGTLPVIRAVLNTTAPKVGTKLTASLLSTALPAGAKTTVSWGYAVQGATCGPTKAAASYPVTAAMAGRMVCGRVTVTAPGYADWAAVLKTASVKETAKASPSRKVVRGTDTFVVKAQGLAPGQRYRISIKGRMFSGKANSYGRVARTVRYKKGLGSAKRTIIVRGYTGKKVTYIKKFKVTYRAR